MKRVLLMICSLLLVCACVFGLFACVAGVKDILSIKEYKEADQQMALDGLETARDGIGQLKDNEQVYLDGVGQYTAGLVQLADGRKQLAEGQKMIDDNTQAYNEGKEQLATIEPLLPLIDTYQQFRNGTIAKLPGFDTAQAWFAAMVKPLGAQLGLELPDDVTDLPAYIDAMVADGKVQLKQYEDGLVQLADGRAQLADGEKQLADGNAQLCVFEDGEKQLADGMFQLLDQMQADFKHDSGEQVDLSLQEIINDKYGEDFNIYALNDDGSVKQVRGCDYLNLDNCSALCDCADEYLDQAGAATESELYGRIATYGIAAVAAIFGLLAGIFGMVASITGGVKTGKNLGIIALILAAAANVVGLIKGYTDYAFQLRNVVDQATATEEELANMTYTYCGDLQVKALIVLAAAALLFVIFASIAKKAAKKNQAKANAQVNVAAASVAAKSAETANNERLAKLEAENAELKAMVGALAEEANTVKE